MSKTDSTQLMVTADPLAVYIAVKSFKNRLSRFVDNFFLGIHSWHYGNPHSPENPETHQLEEMHEFFNRLEQTTDNVRFVYPEEGTTQHGTMLNELVKATYDDCKSNLLITETDDFFVSEEVLENHIAALNRGDYDFVGEGRGCTNNQLLLDFEKNVCEEDKVFVNAGEDPMIGQQCHYWPTHFLIKKKFVNKDDRFEAFGEGKDQYDLLGNIVNRKNLLYRGREFYIENTVGDTFVNFSMNMMSRINRGYDFKPFPLPPAKDHDHLYFLTSGLVNTYNYQIPEHMMDLAFKQFSLHTGSGSSLMMFPIVSGDKLLEQAIFRQIREMKQNNDSWGLIELYRRTHLYRAGFEAVKDDEEFSIFRERCETGFAELDKLFKEVDVDGYLKERENWLLPIDIYIDTFKRIVGKI